MASGTNSSIPSGESSSFQLRPVPEITNEFASDEESFVVLGQSLDCDISIPISYTDTARSSIIESAERNTNEALAKLSNSVPVPLMPAFENHFEPQIDTNVESINTANSDCLPEEIQQKLNQLIHENHQLKNTILQNNLSMKSHYERIVAWQGDVQKTYMVHKEKFEEAKKYIATLKAEISKLKEVIEKKSEEVNSLKATLSEQEVIQKSASVVEDSGKISELENSVATLAIANKKLETENTKLRSSQRGLHICEKPQIPLQHHIEDRSGEVFSFQEELKRTKHQLMLAQQKITDLEITRNVANAQLNGKDGEILKLGDLLKIFKYTEDDLFALREQLAIYKTDFETEQSAKETIRTEKNQLAEDMQNLQMRNRKLQEEIELLRNGSGFEYVPDHRPPANSRSRSTSSPSNHKFECPKCMFAFTTYQALENHVHRCLDMADALP